MQEKVTSKLIFPRLHKITQSSFFRFIWVLIAVYIFIVAIKLMGSGFKDMGSDFSEGLIQTVENPFSGLFVGVLATAIIQSSSTTTSITVGLVASGAIPVHYAIPMVIGANVGTTITNILVSLGHITRKHEFRRAFAAATVHDMFNLCAGALLFTVEQLTRLTMGKGLIHFLAESIGSRVGHASNVCLVKPMDVAISPSKALLHDLAKLLANLLAGDGDIIIGVISVIIAIVILISALKTITATIRKLSGGRMQRVINTYLFRSNASAFGVGVGLTSVVQSSSITTSLVVPLAGAGMVKIERVYAYSLGANIGTTVTSLLAALACLTGHEAAVTVALAHLIFNILGISIFYPLKKVPLGMSRALAKQAVARKWVVIAFIGVTFFLVPLAFIFILR